MLILSKHEVQRLEEIESFEHRLTNEYLHDVDDPQTRFIFEKYFPMFAKGGNVALDPKRDNRSRYTGTGNQIDRLELLNISMSFPYTIASIYSDYIGTPEMPYEIDIEQQKMSYSWGGMGIFVVRKNEDGTGRVEYLNPSYYVRYSENDQAIYYYYEVDAPDTKGFTTLYVLEQRYIQTGTRVVTKNNTLYQVDGYTQQDLNVHTEDGVTGQIVPLSTLPETASLPEIEEINASRIPIVVVSNEKIKGSTYGTSDIKKVESLISSIEVQVVNIQDQLLKHLQAKLAVPASKLPSDPHTGLVDASQLEIIAVEAGEPLPAYILNQNPLIKAAFDKIELLIKQICTIVRIPYEFFPISTKGGVESADAKEIRISNFMKRIEIMRKKFSKGIKEINEILKDLKVSDAPKDEAMSPSWGEVFPKDKHKLALEQQVAIDAGFLSRLRACMRYLEISEEEAMKELERISEEEQNIETVLPTRIEN